LDYLRNPSTGTLTDEGEKLQTDMFVLKDQLRAATDIIKSMKAGSEEDEGSIAVMAVRLSAAEACKLTVQPLVISSTLLKYAKELSLNADWSCLTSLVSPTSQTGISTPLVLKSLGDAAAELQKTTCADLVLVSLTAVFMQKDLKDPAESALACCQAILSAPGLPPVVQAEVENVKMILMNTMTVDFSQLKQAREALRGSQKLYRQVANSPLGLLRLAAIDKAESEKHRNNHHRELLHRLCQEVESRSADLLSSRAIIPIVNGFHRWRKEFASILSSTTAEFKVAHAIEIRKVLRVAGGLTNTLGCWMADTSNTLVMRKCGILAAQFVQCFFDVPANPKLKSHGFFILSQICPMLFPKQIQRFFSNPKQVEPRN
jgi:hypothetical protein